MTLFKLKQKFKIPDFLKSAEVDVYKSFDIHKIWNKDLISLALNVCYTGERSFGRWSQLLHVYAILLKSPLKWQDYTEHAPHKEMHCLRHYGPFLKMTTATLCEKCKQKYV